MEKLPLDTLLLMFYYREGTFAQLSASRELKRRQWRFHKKLGIWFRRAEKAMKSSANGVFEYGSFNFFDLDSWSLKTRHDFTFEYEYLEVDDEFDNEHDSLSLSLDLAVRRPPPSS
jgi:CCR4-NOT transcription complex subunit 3